MAGGSGLGCRRGSGVVQAGGVAVLLGLGGCTTISALNPVDWWHNLEGGPIADARPPPPNADAPYPSLGSVPNRPVTNDAAARGQIANALIADRANAQYDASQAPLTVPGTAPPPAAPRPVAPAAGGEDASNATLAAASAPPAPPVAPPPAPPRLASAPRPAVQAAPLAAPAPAQAAASAPAAPLADMPPAPPSPPALPGVKQVTAPTPPAPTPPPVPKPAPVPVAGAPAPIAFGAGSAVLPSAAYAPLKSLAQQRGGGTIAVVGFGGASDTSAASQAAAMPLALARARAIATYLETAGVPASAVRIDAEAVGQGGVARLIH